MDHFTLHATRRNQLEFHTLITKIFVDMFLKVLQLANVPPTGTTHIHFFSNKEPLRNLFARQHMILTTC
jgi:hypothetical protein